MWKLWHAMFGWHYVAVSYGQSYSVRRVRFDGDRRPYVRLYDVYIDLLDIGCRDIVPLTFPRAWLAATSTPYNHRAQSNSCTPPERLQP